MNIPLTDMTIEPVHGCDKRCPFCSLSQYPADSEVHYMDSNLFYNNILSFLKRHQTKFSKISFSRFGEPTMHPDLLDFIYQTRQAKPESKVTVITNGHQLRKRGDTSYIRELIKAGASHIMIDCYEYETFEIFENDKDGLEIEPSYGEKGTVWHTFENKILHVSFLNKPINQVDTQAGSVPYKNWESYSIDPKKLPKRVPCFQLCHQIVILYNGNVPICCKDGSKSLILGNIQERSIEEIWGSDFANELRYALFNCDRELIPPCALCSATCGGYYPLGFRKDYDRNHILDMVSARFKPDKDWVHNIREFHKENAIPKYLKELLDRKGFVL